MAQQYITSFNSITAHRSRQARTKSTNLCMCVCVCLDASVACAFVFLSPFSSWIMYLSRWQLFLWNQYHNIRRAKKTVTQLQQQINKLRKKNNNKIIIIITNIVWLWTTLCELLASCLVVQFAYGKPDCLTLQIVFLDSLFYLAFYFAHMLLSICFSHFASHRILPQCFLFIFYSFV